LMKSTPLVLSMLTAFRPSSGVTIAIDAANATLGPSSIGPEMTMGTDQPMRRNLGLRSQHGVEIAADIANARDAVRDKQREHVGVAEVARPTEVGMCVHVPETRDHVHAFRVDDLSARRRGGRRGSSAHDAVSLDDDGRSAVERAARDVDDGCLVIVSVCAERRGVAAERASRSAAARRVMCAMSERSCPISIANTTTCDIPHQPFFESVRRLRPVRTSCASYPI
jgi:hypothetical protein